MKSLQKTFLALAALLGAFYLSISYRYGDPGWRLEFEPAATAEARSGVIDGYDLQSLSILNRAVIHLKENYVDPSRINERKMLGAAMEEVQRAIAELLVEVERDPAEIPTGLTVRIGEHSRRFDLTDVGNLWQMSFKFKDIFRFIGDNLRHHTRLQDIEYAAINGMLSTLDPHSVLLRPEDYREMKLSTRGKFGGLGIVISIRDGQLTVVNPMDDTPASRAGIKALDRVVQIGLDSTVNMALQDAVDLLRGEPGTPVDLWILRDGWKKARKYTLTRADIKVQSVTATLLDGDIAFVRVANFQNTTHDELVAALDRLAKKARNRRLAGLVLDMRGNPGGLLDQAIKIADLFISSGPLVTTVGFGDRMREPKMATRAGTEAELPIVVLQDDHSASASEIVAGALKNHHRALIVGQRSFGKGSVQVIYDNKDDSALKLTIAQYLTPGDVSIQSVGITPDIETRAIVVTDERTDLFRTESEIGGEVSLPAHLDHERAEVSRGEAPAGVVEYLRDEALHKKIEENPDDLIVDAEVAFARDLLRATRAANRDEMLRDGAAVIEARRVAEEARIAEALAARGVDWRADAVTAGAPRAAVTVRTDRDGDRVTAGETLRIEATVRNTGDAPFTRLHAITASDNELLAGHELVFGRVEPGEQRTWSVEVELPKSALTRRDQVTLAFADATHPTVTEAKLKVDVQQLPRPRFALHWRVDDRAAGNGDGLLQLGEEAELVVEAKNLGPGKSEKVLGTLRNDETDLERGVYLKKARVEHAALAPGDGATLRLSFKVKVARPGEVPVMVGVYDSEIRESTTEKALLTVVPEDATVTPAAVTLAGRGDRLPIRGVPHPTAPAVAVAAGHVRADARYGGWYRVPLADGHGWISADDVQPTAAPTGTGAVAAIDPQGPPVIELAHEPLQVETRDRALTLAGAISGERPVRDVLIYVNNKKVYFKSNAGHLGDPFRFSAEVPLEEGSNRITMIAREDEEQASRRTVIVHRTP
ncbi:MAG: MXAN_5808 family serine peptidase [bacterium]|nr:PDZ domain-containing protein [Myxococcales bacterium]